MCAVNPVDLMRMCIIKALLPNLLGKNHLNFNCPESWTGTASLMYHETTLFVRQTADLKISGGVKILA